MAELSWAIINGRGEVWLGAGRVGVRFGANGKLYLTKNVALSYSKELLKSIQRYHAPDDDYKLVGFTIEGGIQESYAWPECLGLKTETSDD